MKKFKVVIKTEVEGSEREDFFETEDDTSGANIEQEAFETAMNMVEWYYEEVLNE